MPEFIPPVLSTPEQVALLAEHEIRASRDFDLLTLDCTCTWTHTEVADDATEGILGALQRTADAGLAHIVDELRKAGLT